MTRFWNTSQDEWQVLLHGVSAEREEAAWGVKYPSPVELRFMPCIPTRACSRAARDRQAQREPDIGCSVLEELVWGGIYTHPEADVWSHDHCFPQSRQWNTNKDSGFHCSFTVGEIAAQLQTLLYTLNRKTFHLLQMKRDQRGLARGRICVCNWSVTKGTHRRLLPTMNCASEAGAGNYCCYILSFINCKIYN